MSPMNTHISQMPAASQPAPRFFIEMALVIGLPIGSIIIASSMAFVAYVHGFTEVPQQELHSVHHG